MTEKEWTDLGTTNYLKGNIDTAIDNFLYALTIDPNYIDAHFGLGNCYYSRKEWEKAVGYYKTVSKKIPQVASTWVNLGNAYLELEQLDKAREAFLKAIELKSNYAPNLYNLARFYEKVDIKKAIEMYQKVLKLDPKYTSAHYNLGILYHKGGMFKEAIECYNLALETDPLHLKAWLNLGIVFRDQGEIMNGILTYEKALKTLSEHPELWFALGNLYYKRGLEEDLINAVNSYIKGLELAPDEASGWSDLGGVYYEMGDLNKAIDYTQKALHINPKYIKAWFNLGNIYYKKYSKEAVFDDDLPEYKSYALWCFQEGAKLGDKESKHNEQLLLKEGIEEKKPPLIFEYQEEDEKV